MIHVEANWAKLLTGWCEQETVDLERLRNLLNQADEKLAAANQSLEVTRRQKNEQATSPPPRVPHQSLSTLGLGMIEQAAYSTHKNMYPTFCTLHPAPNSLRAQPRV